VASCANATGECQQKTCNSNGNCNNTGNACGTDSCSNAALTTHACVDGVCTANTPPAPCAGGSGCNAAGTACNGKCAKDADCTAAFYCNAAGNCAARKGSGATGTCNTAAGADCLQAGCRECDVGLTCVDGYCCTSATCGGVCQSCAVKGHEGTCSPALAGSTGMHGSCPGTGGSCAESCDGTHTTCQDTHAGTACGAASCSGDAPVTAPHCLTGSCRAGTTQASCSPYGCSAGACTTTCTTGTTVSGCASDSTCVNIGGDGPPNYVCYKNQGAQCSSATQCQTGNCVGNVCCDTPCTSICDANTSTLHTSVSCSTGTCTALDVGTACPFGFACSGDTCATNCYVTWVGGFPMSGWPTGLNESYCSSAKPYCSCVPASSGATCLNGTHCCATFPCTPSP
jgi:hypothetical protein